MSFNDMEKLPVEHYPLMFRKGMKFIMAYMSVVPLDKQKGVSDFIDDNYFMRNKYHEGMLKLKEIALKYAAKESNGKE